MYEFLIGAAETVLGLFSVALIVALWEWDRTTRRLKKYVMNYINAVEFEWQDETAEFVLMHRVRAFEILLRQVQVLQPRSPGAYYRVEQVRDVLERLHRSIPIFRGEHLPLPEIGKFPLPQTERMEAHFRRKMLERLRAIKWLGLQEPAEQ